MLQLKRLLRMRHRCLRQVAPPCPAQMPTRAPAAAHTQPQPRRGAWALEANLRHQQKRPPSLPDRARQRRTSRRAPAPHLHRWLLLTSTTHVHGRSTLAASGQARQRALLVAATRHRRHQARPAPQTSPRRHRHHYCRRCHPHQCQWPGPPRSVMRPPPPLRLQHRQAPQAPQWHLRSEMHAREMRRRCFLPLGRRHGHPAASASTAAEAETQEAGSEALSCAAQHCV